MSEVPRQFSYYDFLLILDWQILLKSYKMHFNNYSIVYED